jgi:putative MATE family efflux protein
MKNPGNQNHNILDTDRIGWLLVKLTTPAFMGMFVQTLYNVVNTIFVGQFVGTLGIAGLSIAFPLQMLTMGLGMMIGMGGASLISRMLGTGDIAGAEKVVGNGITISVILSAVFMVILLPFTDFWLKLIGASEAVLPYARDYVIIIISGAVTATFAMGLLSFARAEGNARVGMTSMIIGAILSIVLSALFIIPMKMGVIGAALATVIAQLASTVYLFAYYFTGSSYLKIRPRNLIPDIKILKPMFAVGVAGFVQTVAGSLSAMIVIKMVVSYGGDVALSAYGIIQRIMMFALMPGISIGQGVQPILGYNYGAERYHLALKALIMAAISAISLSTLAFFVLYFIPETLVKIFSSDPELVDAGAYAARRIFLVMPIMGGVLMSTQVFQALGKAMQAFITALVRPVLFLVPMALILSHFWQLEGVWFAFPCADSLTAILVIVLMVPIVRGFREAAAAQKEGYIKMNPGQLPGTNNIMSN